MVGFSMSPEFRLDLENYARSMPSVKAVLGRRLRRFFSVRGRFKFRLLSVLWVSSLRPMLSISDGCRRRFESALLTDSSIVEFNAQVFGNVLDLDDEFGSLLAFLNPARDVPVQVHINVKRGRRNHADLTE